LRFDGASVALAVRNRVRYVSKSDRGALVHFQGIEPRRVALPIDPLTPLNIAPWHAT